MCPEFELELVEGLSLSVKGYKRMADEMVVGF